MLTFQEVILRLQQYWNGQGCALLQPIDIEVGAGTSHTATFLRALGPEPWRAAYVQPSRRPKDARYGENPNRLHQHHQFQVVLKPAPTDIVDRYLGSLRALGIDTEVNDIRFVEDNWENPTLGAWGLGWEVWMNGMEVTQFTYFQQIGGEQCDGYTAEEMKLQNEGRKILHLPDMNVACTCVRVPVVRSHSISAAVHFAHHISVDEARAAIAAAPGCRLVDDLDALQYPMPLDTSDQDLVFVGRIRPDLTDPNGLCLWCCGDQVRKGAATNCVQIAELLIQNG